LAADLPDHHPGGYALVFSDEFNGGSLDRAKWCTRYVYGGGAPLQISDSGCTGPGGWNGTLDFLNDEQERYVDFNANGEIMHAQVGGTLKLRATNTRADAYARYEAAMIRSKLEFRPSAGNSYYIAARLRLPNVVGTWPAMWLVGGFGSSGTTQWPPEIDIFEGALNGVEDRDNMIRMGSQVKGGRQTNSGAQEITFSQSFDPVWSNHIATQTLRDLWVEIGAEWTANSICYFVDGVKTMCENYRWTDDAGVPANPASLLLNLAIGGGWAGRHGIDDSKFPTALEADYVRVYATAPTVPPPVPPPAGDLTPTAYLIDAGDSTPYTAQDGRVWAADVGFVAGTGGVVDRGPIPVANSNDAKLFQTERWCMDGYSLPIANGSYLVNLYFAETSPNVNAAGARVFDVDVEGRVIAGLDVFQETGGRSRALVRTLTNVIVADGALTLGFTRHSDCPMINAIEVQATALAQPMSRLLVESGGDAAFQAMDGRVWLADHDFLVGDGGVVDRGPIAIANSFDARLFQTERWCLSGYELPVNNGSYRVTLSFAETSPNVTGPGGRVFDVSVEGAAQLTDLDVFKESGGRNRALAKTLDNVPVVDGALSIAFTKKSECPMINAIEVQPIGFNPTTAVLK
jgi:beta-glucanase (GH16 family)